MPCQQIMIQGKSSGKKKKNPPQHTTLSFEEVRLQRGGEVGFSPKKKKKSLGQSSEKKEPPLGEKRLSPQEKNETLKKEGTKAND